MIEKAQRLLEPGKPITLVTTGEDGRPDARAMSTVKTEARALWMLTGKCSDKYKELLRRPECLVYATDANDGEGYMEVRLWGKMELLDDPASRALAWRDEYLGYFPGGQGDPNVIVLKFTPESGVLQTMTGKENLSL
ncbi:MAG: pyridoxamine 5'-phosphate oxidase family protein [Candidatus Adiutrix sp.]|jgi:general stress protein 26|nr:pyridoxamine 5'-phosphate oxidase family protein [Candidatus Adiutrix sp.]